MGRILICFVEEWHIMSLSSFYRWLTLKMISFYPDHTVRLLFDKLWYQALGEKMKNSQVFLWKKNNCPVGVIQYKHINYLNENSKGEHSQHKWYRKGEE